MTWVPANPKLSPEDVKYQLSFFDCKVLIYQSAFADLIDAIRDDLPMVVAFICLDEDMENAPSLAKWMEGASGERLEVPVEPNSLAMLMPTGGTTGRPKGVQLTNRVIATFLGTAMYCFSYSHAENPVALVAAPITHAAGLLALPIIARGGRVVIIAKPDINEVLDTIEREKITELFLPPTVIYRLLDVPSINQRNFSTLKYFTYGAAPMSTEKLRTALRVFGP
jgi:acyl-CoA synthetase (AMP-forming)/AMP-acid ligase II